MHYVGIALVLFLISAVGVYSGRQVKSASDFASGGRKAGAGIVAGSIIGSLVGGSSTIGTAQLAFTYGFSAWWFTLGAGLGCLVLGCCFAGPLYNSGIQTLPQVFAREYGRTSSTAATVLTSVGNFLTVASQVLSGVALITSVSPLNDTLAAVLTVALMMVYVVFGGVWGTGYVGMAKTVLLYLGVGTCGVMAVRMQGGFPAFAAALPAAQYFNLFARGVSKDLGSGLSLIFGVLSTQAYIQAVISARSLKLSRAGALACAAVIPVIGIAGIYIGMYMKLNYPGIASAAALPTFVLEKAPPLLAGVILATLLVTVVGTGAGISLGISSMFCTGIYRVYLKKDAGDGNLLFMSRLVIVAVLAGAFLFTLGNMGSMILSWGFMSMGLRGAVAFGPLCAAILLPGRISQKYVLCSMVVGPLFVLFGSFFLPPSVDPLFPGIGSAFLILATGLRAGGRKPLETVR